MKNAVHKKRLLLVIYIFVAVSTFVISVENIRKGLGQANTGNENIGLYFFRTFTNDSNLLGGISSLVQAVYLSISMYKKEDRMPYFAVVFQFVSAVALGLTFIVVAAFLAPKHVANGESYLVSYEKDMFFFHFLNPLLVNITLVLGEKKYKFGRKENLIGLVPSIIYAQIYVYFVLIKKDWLDFYGFTFGGKAIMILPVSIIIYSISYLAGNFLIRSKNKYVTEKVKIGTLQQKTCI